MNNYYVVHFNVDGHDQVHADMVRETFIATTTHLNKVTVTIFGNIGSSLISISGVADFFDINWEWEYQWEFVGNEYVEPKVLVAVVNGT